MTFEFPFANVPMKLPDVILPDTVSAVNVPTDVMFGCAAVVTVPAVVAEVAVPALVAYVALATVPVTFAPVIDDRFAPETPAANNAFQVPEVIVPTVAKLAALVMLP